VATSSNPNRGLGRGLSALIPSNALANVAETLPTEIEIDHIEVNPEQPRTVMNAETLEELTQSVKEHGIIQPLLVTKLPSPETEKRFQLVAGERRLRAAQAAGLTHVPVTVRETTRRDQLELALTENVQREDLSALEEAQAYRRLADEFSLTQQQIAERVGCSRTKVTNRIRLLELPSEILEALSSGRISEGHARALLAAEGLTEQLEVLQRIERKNLSVRQTEQIVRGLRKLETSQKRGRLPDPELEELADVLRRNLGTKIGLRRTKRGNGTLTIHFFSTAELDGILERLLPEWHSQNDN
jgi:ParB family chromosome partitioning protein